MQPSTIYRFGRLLLFLRSNQYSVVGYLRFTIYDLRFRTILICPCKTFLLLPCPLSLVSCHSFRTAEHFLRDKECQGLHFLPIGYPSRDTGWSTFGAKISIHPGFVSLTIHPRVPISFLLSILTSVVPEVASSNTCVPCISATAIT